MLGYFLLIVVVTANPFFIVVLLGAPVIVLGGLVALFVVPFAMLDKLRPEATRRHRVGAALVGVGALVVACVGCWCGLALAWNVSGPGRMF